GVGRAASPPDRGSPSCGEPILGAQAVVNESLTPRLGAVRHLASASGGALTDARGPATLFPPGPLAEPQVAAADPDQVAGVERRRLRHPAVVQVRAGGRVVVLDQVLVAPVHDPRVQLLDLVVAEQPDVTALGAADGQLLLGDHHLAAAPATPLHPHTRLP